MTALFLCHNMEREGIVGAGGGNTGDKHCTPEIIALTLMRVLTL